MIQRERYRQLPIRRPCLSKSRNHLWFLEMLCADRSSVSTAIWCDSRNTNIWSCYFFTNVFRNSVNRELSTISSVVGNVFTRIELMLMIVPVLRSIIGSKYRLHALKTNYVHIEHCLPLWASWVSILTKKYCTSKLLISAAHRAKLLSPLRLLHRYRYSVALLSQIEFGRVVSRRSTRRAKSSRGWPSSLRRRAIASPIPELAICNYD